MSYKQCIFGVPVGQVTQEKLLTSIADSMRDLAGDIALPDVYVLINDEADAMKRGLWLFMLGCTVAKNTRVDRGFFVDSITSSHSLVILLHDDQNGVHLFRYYDMDRPPSVGLMSDGPYLGGTMGAFDVDYPQKGYSREELEALHKKGEAALTDREAKAIMEYHNAIAIGLRQFFPRLGYAQYLDLLHLPNAFHVYSPKKRLKEPAKVKRPDAWYNMMAFWPEDSDWYAAKLPMRPY